MPRLRLSRYDHSWTELFKVDKTLRRLRVVVDADLLAGPVPAALTPIGLLGGLLTHDDLEVWRYADGGPPPGIPELPVPWSDAGYAIGWIVATPAQPADELVSHDLVWSDGRTATHGGIVGNMVEFAANDTRAAAYTDLSVDQARQRREADAVAACAAQELQADLYITERPYLHAATWALADGVNFCSPRDALAVVGLYLRSQGTFLISRGTDGRGSETLNKGLFYWVGARELLPEGWRWFTACVTHDHARGADELIYLGGAVFQRLTRTLQARDDLLRAMNMAQNHDVAESAVTALDTCLVFLMGALDAAARVAHYVLGLPPADVYRAGWQKNQAWLKDVAARAPTLAAVVGAGTVGLDALTVLRLLRNTVHGAGLRVLAVGRGARSDQETLVGLPRADHTEILAIADRRGGRDSWGLREVLPGELHADPGALLERLLPDVIVLLNNLMGATPVEGLAGVALKPTDLGPPADAHGPFAEYRRQSIRWQLGL